MKNRCKFLFILTIVIVSLFYRADSVVAMAAEENSNPEPVEESATEVEAEAESITEPAVEDETEPESITEPAVEDETEPEPITEPEIGPETEPEQIMESVVEAEEMAEPVATPEPAMESVAEPEAVETISTGQALLAWLESHKNTGGRAKLSDNVVLEGYYSFCPSGMNRPSVFVDTDKYTITVAGEIEFLSDNHLIFSGESDGKGIFYVAEKGILSIEGVVVESSQCALWQEEGAGLTVSNCSISGNIHYADTPFVMYYTNSICAVVEKGQTLNDALPVQISCTVNRQGRLSHNERVPVLWDSEGTERQQEQRQRFELQGSFLHAASSEPVRCTVIYNDAPLTFTSVQASANGQLYTFQGGFTVPEEALPFTVMAEYSFDGENWFLYEEQGVKSTNAGFYIACKLEPVSRAALSNIYIRLQWNDNGNRYFSNVLCYAADDLESAEDIGGSRGGGTSIVNPPETPQETIDDAASEKEKPDQDADRNTGSGIDSDAAKPETLSDTRKTDTANGGIDTDVADSGQVSGAEPANVDAGQSLNAEPVNTDIEQQLHIESANADAEQPSHVESAGSDAGWQLNAKNSDADEESTVTVLSAYGENSADLSRASEQILRADIRRNQNIVIAAGAVALSGIVGAAGFCIHSRSGTKR